MSAAFHQFSIGDFTCTALRDGIMAQGQEGIVKRFLGGSEADYEQAYAVIGERLDDAALSYNCLVIQTGSETVLVDSGQRRALLESMQMAGLTPAQVTCVIITHAHVDHVLGLLNDAGESVFPNARFYLSELEMPYWQGRISSGQVDHAPIIAMMQAQGLTLIAMDAPILPGITAVPLPGHTPGQIGLRIESRGEVLYNLADTLHLPIQFAHPEWSPTFDADTNQSVPTRRAMVARVADEGAQAMFFHLTFPGVGRVRMVEGAPVWEKNSAED